MSAPNTQSTADLKPAGPLGTAPVDAPSEAQNTTATATTAEAVTAKAKDAVRSVRESSAWYNWWVGVLAQFVLILVVGGMVTWFMGWFQRSS